jgi:DNA-binding XRE family transcriptional regulator
VARESDDIAARRRVLGEQLAAFREAAELRQGELARLVFRDRTTLVHIEKGRARADEKFWLAADAAVNAGGALLTAFRELEAAKQAHEQRVQAVELAEARARVAAFRAQASLNSTDMTNELSTSGSELPHSDTLSSIINVLGPSQTLTVLETFTCSVIARYELEGPYRLAPEVYALRQVGRDLGSHVTSVNDQSQLTKLSAQQAALLAYMSVNLSQFADAERYAFEASLLATAVNDSSLLAWIKGTQSFAAYYQQRYRDALNVAQVGLRLAGSDAQRIRLLSNGVARAAGKLGDRQTLEWAVNEALELVAGQDGPAGMTPCIDFTPYGWARTAANVATAYLAVGDYRKVLQLTQELSTVVATSDSDWSRSLVMLDEATALTLGRQADIEYAAAVGINALAASAGKPIVSIGKRATELAVSLQRYGPHRAGDEFVAALREWNQHGSEAIT